ncbi:MAG: hypothetical protein C0428_17025 [Polaromonas sp.]|nr:hypothetical protein [Polaromonas sp.]
MTAFNLINQLLNFMAPAAAVAVLLVLAGRLFSGFFKSKRPSAHSWRAQAAIVFIAGVVLLLAGLLLFGRDGKVASYALLAVGAATCQWLLLRGGKA